MNFTVTVQPVLDPISLTEAKTHCRVTGTEEDGLLVGYILAARQYVEQVCGIALITQTVEAYFDLFSEWLFLPRWPVQSVSSVTYLDNVAASQTLNPTIYYANLKSRPAYISNAYSQVWPATYYQNNAIIATFVAGYGGTPSSIPEPIRQAMLLLIGHWFEQREAVIVGNLVSQVPFTTEQLLSPYRVFY